MGRIQGWTKTALDENRLDENRLDENELDEKWVYLFFQFELPIILIEIDRICHTIENDTESAKLLSIAQNLP